MFDVPCAICKEMITSESQEKQMGDAGVISTAVMIDDKRFSFGISGVFVFKDITLKAGDEVCYNCMKAQKIEDDLSIKCDLCGKLHQPCFDSEPGPHKSAWGCSASVRQTKSDKVNEATEMGSEIGGSFGSKYDMSVYSLKEPMKVGTNICDTCLDTMVATGKAICAASMQSGMSRIERIAEHLGGLSTELTRRLDQLFKEKHIDNHALECISGLLEGLHSTEQALIKIGEEIKNSEDAHGTLQWLQSER